jgi:membrane-bound lytic murein transglycosylase B
MTPSVARAARPTPALFAAGLVLLLSTCVIAPTGEALVVDDHPPLQLLVDEMASKYGFDRERLLSRFAEVRLREDILVAIRRPKENLPWHEYRKLFVTDTQVQKGAEFWKKHAATLMRAEVEFGVPAEIIVAIIGVETRYGKNTGSYRALDALTTLALRYPERGEFFRKELIEYLLLTRELGTDPLAIKGSYAGAMGAPQFIPSSYRRYAVDFNNDGRRDLLASMDDAIGSVAIFLRQHGWQPDGPIVGEARLNGALYGWLENHGIEPRINLRHLARYGIEPVGVDDASQLAALVSLEGEAGPLYRLGFMNFYAVTRYNRSKNYSMAVVELARDIRQHYNSP